MVNEEKTETEKKIEDVKKKETSVLSNVPPIIYILIGAAVILILIFGNPTRNQIIAIVVTAIVIVLLFSGIKSKSGFLTTEEAWEISKVKAKIMQKTGQIASNWKIVQEITSALPPIDGEQREYFLGYTFYNEKNVPHFYVARVNSRTGNTTWEYTPEGFTGKEKPIIRNVLPQEWKAMKKAGLLGWMGIKPR